MTAMAGNRTQVNCLEGSYAYHYTTIATKPLEFGSQNGINVEKILETQSWIEWKEGKKRIDGLPKVLKYVKQNWICAYIYINSECKQWQLAKTKYIAMEQITWVFETTDSTFHLVDQMFS